MLYKTLQPDTLLADFVKCYWWFENINPDPLDFTILPDGCFDLIVTLDNHQQQNITLTGLWTKQVDVCINPGTQLFGIRFKLLAADHIIQQSIANICDKDRLLKNNFWGIDQQSFEDLDKVKEHLDKTMLAIVQQQEAPETRKLRLFKALYATKGGQKVEYYSRQAFWVPRQINRYFTARFGLPLKAYCNILRCHASYPHIKKGQLYPKQNYFDQSHFIKELKKHTGSNPKDLFINKNDRFLQLTNISDS